MFLSLSCSFVSKSTAWSFHRAGPGRVLSRRHWYRLSVFDIGLWDGASTPVFLGACINTSTGRWNRSPQGRDMFSWGWNSTICAPYPPIFLLLGLPRKERDHGKYNPSSNGNCFYCLWSSCAIYDWYVVHIVWRFFKGNYICNGRRNLGGGVVVYFWWIPSLIWKDYLGYKCMGRNQVFMAV